MNSIMRLFHLIFITVLLNVFAISASAQWRCENLFSEDFSVSTLVSTSEENAKSKKSDQWEQQARAIGLNYLKSPLPNGYTRHIFSQRITSTGKIQRYYRFYRPDGTRIKPRLEKEEYLKIKALFENSDVPPSWDQVWLSPDPQSHIQVIAKDSKGRKAYTYHELWPQASSLIKFQRIKKFGQIIGGIREKLKTTLKTSDQILSSSSVEKVQAAALLTLMTGRIRVGNQAYLEENGTRGLTTLSKKENLNSENGQLESSNVIIENDRLYLNYIGKAGNKGEIPKYTRIEITDSLVKAQLLKMLQFRTDDHRLFIYKSDVSDETFAVTPDKLNDLLKNLADQESKVIGIDEEFSVKDFRTWAATVKAAQTLLESGEWTDKISKQEQTMAAVSKKVSLLLTNTPAVARASYIHPWVFKAYQSGQLHQLWKAKFASEIDLGKSISTDDPTGLSMTTDSRLENFVLELLMLEPKPE